MTDPEERPVQFRLRNANVDAAWWTGDAARGRGIAIWAQGRYVVGKDGADDHIAVRTPEGWKKALPGWWIVRSPDGTFGVLEQEQFEALYEKV